MAWTTRRRLRTRFQRRLHFFLRRHFFIPQLPSRDGRVVPRFAGPSTFARLPRLDEVSRCDLAIVGVPFDTGTTYRPGARFGPVAIRQGSRRGAAMKHRHWS